MTTQEALKEARDLIADPGDWCQGNMINGRGQRCAIGALRKVGGTLRHEEALHDVIGRRSVMEYNDTHVHECVLAMFDAAIERCGET